MARRSRNGYVVYPDSIGYSTLSKANKEAKKESLDYGEARVESVNTEEVIARWKYGRKMTNNLGKRQSNPRRIVGVALNPSGKFLGFIDGGGRIRKGRVRRLQNPKQTYFVYSDGGFGPPKNFTSLAKAKRFARISGDGRVRVQGTMGGPITVALTKGRPKKAPR